jgi:hypothetical protein
MRLVHSGEAGVRIAVEDVSDPQVLAEVERVVLAAFEERHLSAEWTVAIAAAETRGRWDVALKGPDGTHLLSFAASAAQLPEFLARHLGRTLDRRPS